MSQTRGATLASGLVVLFLLSLVPSTHYAPLESATESVRNEVTPIGQNQQLTIGSWPDGANQRVELSIPDGHSIKSLNMRLANTSMTFSFNKLGKDPTNDCFKRRLVIPSRPRPFPTWQLL